MANVDWDDLARKVTEIQRNTVSTRSRAVYENSYGRFITWIILYKPHLVSPAFAQRLGDVSGLSFKQLRKRIKPLLDRKKTPPLRMLDGRDMPTRNLQKRLSDARYLMRMVDDEAKRTGSWRAHQSVEDAVKTFAACENSVAVPQHTTNNRKRRRGQLSWITIVALYRRAQKHN